MCFFFSSAAREEKRPSTLYLCVCVLISAVLSCLGSDLLTVPCRTSVSLSDAALGSSPKSGREWHAAFAGLPERDRDTNKILSFTI